ncbi:MAG: hypothetical protein Q9225_004170 [Loekoesia sp. 1 TL-2023]
MEEEKGETGLKMLAEKTLQAPINPELLAYCPTMDLLALATANEHIDVFRTNGQKVFGVKRNESTTRITDIKWKSDGQSLAVAFDRSMCIASAYTGKVMYEKDHSTPSPICCLGWACNFTDTAPMQSTISSIDNSLTLDEFIGSAKGAGDTQRVTSLPVELGFMDIASTLPKLSALPIGGSQ